MTSPIPRRLRTAAGAFTATLALVLAPTVASAGPGRPGEPRFTPGAPGVGDTYFPLAGNGGIDVQHYDLDLRYAPLATTATEPPFEAAHLDATATITLTPTKDLDAFNLDLVGMAVERVTVNGKRATFSRDGQELTISPRPKLRDGRTATVVIDYAGVPTQVDTPVGPVGWIPTDDGVLALNEPNAAPSWFPSNDHPTDKASYTFDITVPEGVEAIANGLPAGHVTADGWTTWSWDAPDVMATYLATVTIGQFEITDRVNDAGIRVVDAIDPDIPADMRAALDATDAQLAFFTDLFGFYPYVAYGSIVDDYPAGLALETNTRPVYGGFLNDYVAAHEMAHQWTGNLVSPADWHDIWLNEGWATYLGFYWQEFAYGVPATDQMRFVYEFMPAEDPMWAPAPGEPGLTDMFGFTVYYKGAMAIDQLRIAVGEDAFRAIAREWVTRYEDGTASTEQFQALAEEVSGQDLDALFAEWVYSSGKPAQY